MTCAEHVSGLSEESENICAFAGTDIFFARFRMAAKEL